MKVRQFKDSVCVRLWWRSKRHLHSDARPQDGLDFTRFDTFDHRLSGAATHTTSRLSRGLSHEHVVGADAVAVQTWMHRDRRNVIFEIRLPTVARATGV